MSRGHARERALVHLLRDEGWFAMRAPASLGVADVVALKEGQRARLIEVKSTAAGPFHSFGPADRAALSLAAEIAGANAYLVWWPPRGERKWIAEWDWPATPTERTAA